MVVQSEASTLAVSSYHHKLRQFGAMLDVHREMRGREEMLVVADTSKKEISAGGPWIFTAENEERWSVFAGGRDEESEGPQDTLVRELQEEFDELSQRKQIDSFPAEIQAAIHGLVALPAAEAALVPFIVGQLKQKPDQPLQINEVAASSVVIPYDQFPSPLRRAFDHLVQLNFAKWIGIDELADALTISRVFGNPHVGSLAVRPQLLTLAKLHALQKIDHVSDEAVERQVLGWNSEIATHLTALARRHGVTINNGVFTDDGRVDPNLSMEDRQYLGMK